MFTVEYDHDDITITVLCDENNHEDVIFDIFDDIVYIRQWNEELELFDTIIMSPDMFDQFCKSLYSTEGAYTKK